MYLTRKKYIGAKWEHRNITGSVIIKQNDKEIPIDFKKITYIEEEVGYWRKANAIHKWFVDNVQNEVDDCKEYYVSIEDIKNLLNLCEEVEKDHNKSDELLPTKSGFFFGSLEYDEYYFEDIKYTINMLKEIIKEEEELNKQGIFSEFYYRSSW